MSNIKFIAILLFTLVIFPFCLSSTICAADVFVDEFDQQTLDAARWVSNPNLDNVFILNGVLNLYKAGSTSTFPYVYNLNQLDMTNGTTIELKFRYSGSLNYGNGIVFSDNLPEYGTTDDAQAADFVFKTWPTRDNTFWFASSPCPDYLPLCENDQFNSGLVQPLFDMWHTLSITRTDGRYDVTLDDFHFQTKQTNKTISRIWIGNPQVTGSVIYPRIEIDYIRVTREEAEEPVTPKKKVVLVPGMGASWDVPALLNGGESDDWHVPDFVKAYDNLTAALDTTGYQKDTDYSVFAYDWRKSITANGVKLCDFINNLELSTDEKVTVVGHSMGGLVGGSCLVSGRTDKIEKFVSAGTPYLGATKGYLAWAGGVIDVEPWWLKAALEIYIQANKLPWESRVETIRRLIPSFAELIPQYDFLIKNGVLQNVNLLTSKSTLESTLSSALANQSNVAGLVGQNQETLDKVVVGARGFIDMALKQWPDGKPSEIQKNSAGDDTVMTSSAKGLLSNTFTGDWNHGDLVSAKEAINKLFELAGIAVTSDLGTNTEPSRVVVAMLQSPGQLEVTTPGGIVVNRNNAESLGYVTENEGKLLMLPGIGEGKLLVKVFGGNGRYKLSVGLLDRPTTDWEEYEEVIDERADYYPFEVSSENITTDRASDRWEPRARQIDGISALTQLFGGRLPTDLMKNTPKWLAWAYEQKRADILTGLENLIARTTEVNGQRVWRPKDVDKELLKAKVKAENFEKGVRVLIQIRGGTQRALWYEKGVKAMRLASSGASKVMSLALWQEAEVWLTAAMRVR